MDIFGTKKRQQQQDAEMQADDHLRHLIERTMMGDEAAGHELAKATVNARARRLGLETAVQVARKQHTLSQNFARVEANLRYDFEEWQRYLKSGKLDEAAASYSFFRSNVNKLYDENLPLLSSKLGIDLEASEAQYLAAVQKHYDELLKLANASHNGMKKLRQFIEIMRIYDHRIAHVDYPDNWNDLVARFIPRPTIKDFIGLKDFEKNRTDWLYKAGEAKSNRDIALAKQVIAVYAANHHKASEAMSQKVSDLVDMVAAENART